MERTSPGSGKRRANAVTTAESRAAMIFNEGFLFIHIGKTGGMSCSQYLLNNLKAPVFNCHDDALKEIVPHDPGNVTPLTGIKRHCTITEALTFIQRLKGWTLRDFQRVVAVIRNPYHLEYSLYTHRRKPQIKARQRELRPDLVALAEGPFIGFVKSGGYHREDHRQEDYFLIDGRAPEQLTLVRYEALAEQFPAAVAPFCENAAAAEFPHRNRSAYEHSIDEVITPEVEEAIYHKHRYMFDSGYYERGRW